MELYSIFTHGCFFFLLLEHFQSLEAFQSIAGPLIFAEVESWRSEVIARRNFPDRWHKCCGLAHSSQPAAETQTHQRLDLGWKFLLNWEKMKRGWEEFKVFISHSVSLGLPVCKCQTCQDVHGWISIFFGSSQVSFGGRHAKSAKVFKTVTTVKHVTCDMLVSFSWKTPLVLEYLFFWYFQTIANDVLCGYCIQVVVSCETSPCQRKMASQKQNLLDLKSLLALVLYVEMAGGIFTSSCENIGWM